MKQIILDFPKQFEIGARAAENIKIDGDFDNVVICGLGGSALPGSLLLDMADISVPVLISRDYSLPVVANKKSLII